MPEQYIPSEETLLKPDRGLKTHTSAADPHPQYLKEEASGGTAAEVPDHTHASAAQAGTVAHSALTGLTNDEHTQYMKEKASGGTASEVPEHTHDGTSQAGNLATKYTLDTELDAVNTALDARLDALEAAIANLGVWQSWTPTLTNFVAGSGATLAGHYATYGELVVARFTWELGTGFTVVGTGTVSLPVNADLTNVETGQESYPVGWVTVRSDGSSTWLGYASLLSTSTIALEVVETDHVSGFSRTVRITSTVPHAWGAGDRVEAFLTYQAA